MIDIIEKHKFPWFHTKHHFLIKLDSYGNVLWLYGHDKKGTNRTMKVKRPLFGARIEIMWEEQPVDPPIPYLTCVIFQWSSVKNKLVNPEAWY